MVEAAQEQSGIERLACWIVETPAAAVPDACIAQAKLLVLDTIGCGISGWAEPLARDCVAAIAEQGGSPTCQIIGSARRTNLEGATFANGVLVRVLDLNDYVIGDASRGGDMGGHPSDNIPVALAAGEMNRRSGPDVLAAIVLGYEIYGRLKGLMDRHSAWDGVTVSGAVAAGIAGRLMGLDSTRMAHALGLALARSATAAAVRTGHLSAAKSIANALVAQNGVQAARLAARGITGPLSLFEPPRGMQQVFVRAQGLARLADPLGDDAVIMGAHVKAYPCLATGQSIVAAALDLHRQLEGNVDRLAKATLVLADYPTIRRQQQDPGRADPQSRESADHSFPFLAAVSIVDGAFGLAQFENERWNDRRVRQVMSRFTFDNDPAWGAIAPDSYPCRIEATTTDGLQLTATSVYPPGFSKARLSKTGSGGIDLDTVISKFSAVTAPHLSASAKQAMIDAVMALETSRDLRLLTTALAVPVGAAT